VATLLTITGSLNDGSANTRLLDAAAALLPDGWSAVRSTSVEDLPHFRPDREAPADGPVDRFRREIAAASAVLIATPEYAHALPGALKDALDWIVGSGELYGKPVAIVSAAPAPERGAHAREMLERTLRAQGADVRWSETIAMAPGSDVGEDTGAALSHVLQALLPVGPATAASEPVR
jgi:NAD(P)H-dependent FMN reductase